MANVQSIPAHYQKQIKQFENAYVRKQHAMDFTKKVRDIIAKRLGYQSYYDMIDASYKHEGSGFWNEFNWELRNCEFAKEFEKQSRVHHNANRMLDRTKYTYWHYHPQGTPKVMAFGKFDYKLNK